MATTEKQEELDHLSKDTSSPQILEDSDDENTSIKPTKSKQIKPTASEATLSSSKLQRANKSIRDLRQKSIQRITRNTMVETMQFNFFMSICSVIIFLLIILTPIASIIGGLEIMDIFDIYSEDDINTSCNGQSDIFLYPTYNNSLSQIGEQIFIIGIVDLCVLISCSICGLYIFYKIWNDLGEITLTCFAIGRSIFMIIWLVYAAFIFDSNNKLNKHCDSNTEFYKDLNGVFDYLVPVYAIEIAKFGIMLCCYCILPFCIIFSFKD